MPGTPVALPGNAPTRLTSGWALHRAGRGYNRPVQSSGPQATGSQGGLTITVAHAAVPRPGLVLFYSPSSGRCRRVEGFLAQVLQRRRNHDTFTLYRVDETSRPDLVARFRVRELPTLVVVERNAVRSRLVSPRSCREIERFLAPWLH